MKGERKKFQPLSSPEKVKSNNYKHYFVSGLYRKRFGKKETYLAEENLLQNAFKKSLAAFKKYPKTTSSDQQAIFQLLDFGCGDGRMLSIFLRIANQLTKEGIKLKITAMDPVQEGLDQYKERLIKAGFILGENKSILSKDNIEIKLTLGDQNNIKNLPDNFDMSVCMFGVLSHIPERAERQKTLKNLNQKTRGCLAITVPGKNIFRKRQKAFEEIRTMDAETENLLEPGDLMYTIKGSENLECGKIANFYHLSTFDEFKKDLQIAEFHIDQIGISAISHPTKLSRNRLFNNADKIASEILTKILPPKLATEAACYIGCIAKNSELVKQEEQRPSAVPKLEKPLKIRAAFFKETISPEELR